MAEAIVSHAVNKLEDLMHGDAESLYGMNDDIRWLKRELKKLLGFLRDGNAKQKQDAEVKSWIENVRDVTHGVEDLVDNYLFRASRFPHSFSSIHSRHSFFKKVDEIKHKINGLLAQRLALGLVNLGANRYITDQIVDPEARSRQCVFMDGDDDVSTSIVGFGEERKAIISQLTSSGDQLLVLSLVGIHGIGKTTLARSVYQSPEIKRTFIARAWIFVTKHCTVINVLKNIMKELVTIPKKIKGQALSERSKCIIDEIKEDYSLERWSEKDIKMALHELIKIKGKCLIIMDDVRSKELWERIQTSFVTTDNGSRVLLTTRSVEVGKHVGPNRAAHELRLLNENESRLLFLKKVYPEEIVHEFMVDLKEAGEELLRICGGLPMHLVLLGSLLSRKAKTVGVWSKVLETLSFQFNDILCFCYDELPLELKNCFLYIVAFEEGSEVKASQLKRLWMAEFLVLDKEGNQERDTKANRYLEELSKRSLVQVTKRKYNGDPSRVRVHRLLQELCGKLSEENNFLNVEGRCSKQSDHPTVITARRVAFYGVIPNTYFDPLSSNLTTPSLRTFMCFGSSKLQHRLGQYLEGLRLLTVIDVEGEKRVTTLPSEISNLIHLRYLRWIVHSNQGVKFLPSLENLHYLQTLATNATITIEDGLGGLKSIRCLTHAKCGLLVAKQLIKLTQLKRLKITLNEAVILNPFEKQRRLESLSLFGEEGSIPMEAFTVFPALHKLKIYGILADSKPLPAHTSFPQGLTKLTLAYSCLTKDPMPTLEKLPNLMILSLEDKAYDGKYMICSEVGFPQLLRLVLKKLEKLEDWEVGNGAMKRLRSLVIEGCRKLKMLPEGLQQINSLKEIKLIQMGNMVVIE
ncbi:Disease resistance protein (CC-NBS-LRR class) family protein [Rhynchospora pubera]|uniref:Disease resistance protein (CC-NBS-LRR class) family protein n=1 Tax=Rhynchospora pubera TaxID=906938 RepID=A0AAV8EFA2_9POAL|nr:Disease resistance protein (CC-NBS-LRR class) family protein [Rhynchospora pubera]